jgi:hypothetical protein
MGFKVSDCVKREEEKGFICRRIMVQLQAHVTLLLLLYHERVCIGPQDVLVPLTSSATFLPVTVLVHLRFFFRLNQRRVGIRMTRFSTYYAIFIGSNN